MIESEPMRIIGRLSFPLFAWVFAENWQRPSNKKNLITRLVLFGVISQIPCILLFDKLGLNIMFSFAVAAITFSYIRKLDHKIAVLSVGLISATVLKIDYDWYAIVCPLLMIGLKGKGDKRWWWGWTVTNLGYAIMSGYWIQAFAVFAPLILAYYDSSKDQKPSALEKKFFYYFYPLHIGGLAALRAII
jgi:hypothetical protein